jgi:hypothetical protein
MIISAMTPSYLADYRMKKMSDVHVRMIENIGAMLMH